MSGHGYRQTGTLASHVVSSFSPSFSFFFVRKELFLGQRISFFFFIQLLPHLSPLRASHISRKKIISVHRKLRTVSGTRCIYLLGTFIEHLGVLATPQILGTWHEQDTSQTSGSSALKEEPRASDWKWPGVSEAGKCGV